MSEQYERWAQIARESHERLRKIENEEEDKEGSILKYSMLIQWSEADQKYLVTFPEFPNVIQPVTHGRSYEEAARNGQEVLQLLVESAARDGETLPSPKMVTREDDINDEEWNKILAGWSMRLGFDIADPNQCEAYWRRAAKEWLQEH